MDEPIAYLLTWTCHGTWLHGDQRGSVDELHNVPGAPVCESDDARERAERKRVMGKRIYFDAAARGIIEQTIRKHCAIRGWELHAVNARSNHVHVVVSAAGLGPEAVMGQFKAWSTRRLREQGVVGTTGSVWTRHGSTRYIWRTSELAAAVTYVEDAQDIPR